VFLVNLRRRKRCLRRPRANGQLEDAPNLNMSKEIRKRYAHAETCACKAKEAATDGERADYLQLERNWLKLAHSYGAVEVEFDLGLR
jgi:hypothetical protein